MIGYAIAFLGGMVFVLVAVHVVERWLDNEPYL